MYQFQQSLQNLAQTNFKTQPQKKNQRQQLSNMELEGMNKTYDSRKKVELTNLLFEFFQNSQFQSTATKLKQEALLNPNNRQNINSFIQIIKNSSGISQNEKSQKIKNRLEKQFVNSIKKNMMNQALQILNNLMPNYFQQTQKFADYFFNPPKQQPPLLNEIFLTYFQTERSTQQLPTQRGKTIKTYKQIWFVKYGGVYTIAIDLNSKGYMIKDGNIVFEKQQLHDDITTCVRWKNERQFGTCSADKTVKIWDYKFNLLRLISDHHSQVNSLCFSQNFVISGGHGQFIMLHDYKVYQAKPLQIHITKKQITQIQHYAPKNQIIAAFCQYKKKKTQKVFWQSSIKFFNEQTSNVDLQKSFSQQIYGICLSERQKTLFINFKSGQIQSYSADNCDKIRSFYGMLQMKFLIRMQLGGPKQKYLVTGSQDGDAIIYFQGNSNPVCRLFCQKTVVNCASWMGQNLICGCDNGQIIIWQIAEDERFKSKRSKENGNSNSLTTDCSSNANDIQINNSNDIQMI